MRKCMPPVASVILPTFNEKENIAQLIKAIDSHVQVAKEILVVDDDSPDGTAREVKKLQQSNPGIPVRLIVRKSDHGLVPSLNEGIRLAEGKIIAWMDADFSHPPEVLNLLITAVIGNRTDVAVASRFTSGGKQKPGTAGENRFVIAASSLFNTMLRGLIPGKVSDFTSGFIAVRKDILAGYSLQGTYGEYFLYLIAYLSRKRVNIREVGFSSPPRRYGKSKTTPTPDKFLPRVNRYLKAACNLYFSVKQ